MNAYTGSMEGRVASSAGMDCIDILISDIINTTAEHMTDLKRVARIDIPSDTVFKTDVLGES